MYINPPREFEKPDSRRDQNLLDQQNNNIIIQI